MVSAGITFTSSRRLCVTTDIDALSVGPVYRVKQDEVVQIVLQQAESLCAEWA